MGAEREALGGPGGEPRRTPSGERARGEGVLPRIDGYQVVGVLGRGATGVVYSAVQLAVDRPVALKVLHPELMGSKRAVRRMQREARTAAKLAHPGIISAIDMGEQDGLWWYAMELVEGISLAERLAERGTLTEREALRLFIPLVEALQHACEGGVVHRDVKPANILIDARGRARLVDLGLAFAEDDPMLTKAGGTLGTPHYISPEQARDPATADSRSDIWSLGATLYHALCGRPPFEGESVAEILSGVLYHPVPDPRVLAPHLSKGMALVLRKCLTRDPERRYREPAQLLRDLERLRERRAPHVRPAQLDPVAGGRPAWVTWAVAAAAAGLLALVALRPWERDAGAREGVAAVPERWPALDTVRAEWEQGRTSLARALADVRLYEPPVGWELRRQTLETSLRSALQRELADLRAAVEGELDEHLDAGRVEAARLLLARDFPRRLEERTGFTSLEALPDAERLWRNQYGRWLGQQVERVEGEREAQLGAARLALLAHLTDVVVPAVQADVAGGRWLHAVGRLAPDEGWLDAAPSAAGLSPADRTALLADGGLARRLDAERRRVQNDWIKQDGELARYVDDENQRLRQRVIDGDVLDAATELRLAYEAERDRRGVDAAQVPEEWRTQRGVRIDSGHYLQKTCDELATFERARMAEVAARTLQVEVGRADGLCRRRRYAEAAARWEALLADPTMAPVAGALGDRLREARLLVAVLERAAASVRRGDRVRAVFDRLPYENLEVRSTVDVLARGFEVQDPNLTRSFRVHLVRPDSLEPRDQVLEADDLLRFAGLQGDALTPAQAFQRSLFLFYEERFEDAYRGLPSADFEGDDLLPELRERIRAARQAEDRAVQERDRLKADALFRLRQKQTRGGTTRDLLQELGRVERDFGDVLSEDERRELGELREALERGGQEASLESVFQPSEPPRGNLGEVELVWRFPAHDAGAWQPGEWSNVDPGLMRLAPCADDEAFLDPARHPRLALRAPFDPTQPLELVLELRSLGAGSRADELLVSVADVHLVFVDRAGTPTFLAGRGDPRALLDSARRSGDPAFGGFEGWPDGGSDVAVALRLRLDPRGGALDVWLDGRKLRTAGVGRRVPPSEPLPEPALVVRSRQPMLLSRATLSGKRLRTR